jgi:hypothetical protein
MGYTTAKEATIDTTTVKVSVSGEMNNIVVAIHPASVTEKAADTERRILNVFLMLF